jgi:very-short-patch-repair endonuclease
LPLAPTEFPSPLRGGVRGGGVKSPIANNRVRQLRRNRTTAERLWSKRRELKKVGFTFRQQVPGDPFVVDFACFSKRLIIEIDGGTHSSDEERPIGARREQYLRNQGFRAVRFWNSGVAHNIEGVMDTIVGALGPPPPSPPRKGEGRSRRHDSPRRASAETAVRWSDLRRCNLDVADE